MDLDGLEHLWKRIWKRPLRTTFLLILILLLGTVALWASGFFGEFGRQLAARVANDDDSVPGATDPQQPKPLGVQGNEKTAIVRANELPRTPANSPTTDNAKATTVDNDNNDVTFESAEAENEDRSRQQSPIREQSASEVVRNVQEIETSNEFSEKVHALYLGHWTREPGWRATVQELPSPIQAPKGNWDCRLQELETGTIIWATVFHDISALRPGDEVTVRGRITRVSILGSVSLEEATITVIPK